MDEQANRSCWGLTAKVVVVIAAAIAISLLIGVPENSSLLANAAG